MRVSCVMCTYGRFTVVERSVAFFINQDYDPNDCELIIFNTAPVPLFLGDSLRDRNITIINTTKHYTNIGDIRTDALEFASGEIYSCWDDDDFFMPWHLSQSVSSLIACGKKAWKPKYSLWSNNGGETFERMGNNLEASVVVYKNEVFFLPQTGSEHLGWFEKLKDEGQLDESMDVRPLESYCYVWGDQIAPHKQSGDISNPNNFENHKKRSVDFGNRSLEYIDVTICYYNVWNMDRSLIVYSKFKTYFSNVLNDKSFSFS